MTIVNTTILLKHTVAYTYSKLVVLALAGGGLLREDGLGLSVIIWITQGLCHIWNLRSKNHLTNSPPIPSNLLVNERAVIHASKGPHLCSICAERIKHKSLRLEKDRAALTREHPYLPIRTCGIQRSSKNSFVLSVSKSVMVRSDTARRWIPPWSRSGQHIYTIKPIPVLHWAVLLQRWTTISRAIRGHKLISEATGTGRYHKIPLG